MPPNPTTPRAPKSVDNAGLADRKFLSTPRLGHRQNGARSYRDTLRAPIEDGTTASGAQRLFSMVLCSHNESAYIADAVWSLLACDDPNLEIVVVDDGSIDDTPAVMARFASYPNVRYLRQENRGQAAAFNTGVAAAQGDLIGLADGDDFSFPHRARTIRWLFDTHGLWNQPVLLRHPLMRFPHVPNITPDYRPPDYATLTGRAEFAGSELKCLSTAVETRAHIARYGFWPFPGGVSSGSILTRCLAERVFPLPEHLLRHCGDLFPVLSACVFGDVYATPLPLGGYRIHGGNHSLTAGRQSVAVWHGIEAWLNAQLEREGLPERVDFLHSPQGVSYLIEQGRAPEALRHATRRALQFGDQKSAKALARAALLAGIHRVGLFDWLARTGRLW